jgi:hypothetical protein
MLGFAVVGLSVICFADSTVAAPISLGSLEGADLRVCEAIGSSNVCTLYEVPTVSEDILGQHQLLLNLVLLGVDNARLTVFTEGYCFSECRTQVLPIARSLAAIGREESRASGKEEMFIILESHGLPVNVQVAPTGENPAYPLRPIRPVWLPDDSP